MPSQDHWYPEHEGEIESNAARALAASYIGRGQSTYTPTQLVVDRAEGVYLWTLEGRQLLDMTSGVLVNNLGYGHAGFERRFHEYMGQCPRNTYNMLTKVMVQASRRLVESMGIPHLDRVLWAASGSEGIQKAMWAAMHGRPGRPILVGTRHGFHGKKGLAGDVSGESSANPNVRFVSFPMDDSWSEVEGRSELLALSNAHGEEIALLVTEPYLGAAGSYHPPKWYHQLLQEWCNAHEAPLIFDEVQSCFGRTGNMYAFQTYDVAPDLVVLGKGMANGAPAAAVVGRGDLIDALDFGEASDTFSGNPEACAAVCATMDVMEEEGVVENARAMGERMGVLLNELAGRFPFITQVRGEGLVHGIEMEDKEVANRCVLEAYRGADGRGVHFLGPLAGKVLRVSPPLVIEDSHLDELESLLSACWKRV